jgi:hypothetical protein
MADAFVNALFEVLARDDVRSITAKGSSRKPWDSPIDYVPEFSDVDIHVLFTAPPDPDRYYLSLEQGLRMQESLEQGYSRRVPNPIHIPRLQFIPVNVMEREPLFVPSPASTVHVLYGEPYLPPEIDEEQSRSAARSLLLDYRPFLISLGEHVSEKSTHYLWDLLRQLTWRVAPAGPRALEVIGLPHEKAWGGNRSTVVRLLVDAGQDDLAEAYTSFYLSEWDFFLSRYTDGAAGRAIVRSGARVLALARSVAEEG